MKSGRKYIFIISCLGFLIGVFAIRSCEAENPEEILIGSLEIDLDFPDFITPTRDWPKVNITVL